MFSLSEESRMGRKQSGGAEAVWRERLTRFDAGDLTVAEFCRREGVSNPSFYQWRKRLRRRAGSARRAEQADRGGAADLPARFVPVNVAGVSAAEIELPTGMKIRVPAANVELLRVAILAGHEACQAVASC